MFMTDGRQRLYAETLRCGKYVFFSSDVEEMKIFLYQEDNYKI